LTAKNDFSLIRGTMPYITQEQRANLQKYVRPYLADAGELNYFITQLLLDYICNNKMSYQKCNDIIGVLECCKQEFYRRKIIEYENTKMKDNGDVY